MKIVINLASFRFKIIITLIIVITSVSFISFYFYNTSLSKMFYKNTERDIYTFLNFFKDQIISIHDGRTLKPSLQELSKSKAVLNTYLLNDEGIVLFKTQIRDLGIDTLNVKHLEDKQDDISLVTYNKDDNHFSRALIRFRNSPACYSCHSSSKKVLGYVVLDFPMHQHENTISYARNFIYFFTILMVVLILVFVLILHFRIIKKSLSEFKSTINKINSGDLDCRVDIPQSKELGELGHSFNTMIDHFQQAQEELQKYHLEEIRNKQKLASIGEMSARLAHEIRNPITGIANAIEIIIGETKESENMHVLEEIQRQANRVSKAISNLLKYSRTKELNVQETSINDIIKSIVFFLKSQGNGKVITYEVELNEDIPLFKFDPEQIENVFLNLGINATQTIDKEGTIKICSSYDPYLEKVTISFSDTGKGIPENKISEIFNPFFTLRTEGTGLGLAIVKEIVDMHNGSIMVYNNPDCGVTFQITLPVNK